MNSFKDYVNDIFDFYRENGVKIDPTPKIVIDKNAVDRFDPFIPTGAYNCMNNTIHLNVGNRHLKDILRTLCHELIHRNQHVTNKLAFENLERSGKLVENEELEEIEADAYRRGNLMFRKWTEQYAMNKA